MKLLLDTHVFLWWCAADPKLSQGAVDAIADGANDVFVSAVNGWEIAIKTRLGKLPLPQPPAAFMTAMLRRHAFDVLSVSLDHALAEFELPAHHNDPFDRLLVAQARCEEMTLVSNDAVLEHYDVAGLW